MTADSDKRLAPFSVGENVRIPVDKVDRGLLDHPYMIGVITEKKTWKLQSRNYIWYLEPNVFTQSD